MIYLKLLRTSIDSLKENKFRTLLTMSGIIIGIASVVLMISLGRGLEDLILSSIRSFGPDAVFVQPGGGTQGGPPSLTAIDKVKYKDYVAMRDLDYLKQVTPILLTLAPVSYKGNNVSVSVVGSNENYADVQGTKTKVGRFIEAGDIANSSKVVVLGYKIADELFGDQNPLDKIVDIKGFNFRVVGVLDKQGQKFFQDFDKRIIIPITVMRNNIRGVDYLQSILAKVNDGDVEGSMDDLRFFIRKRHNLKNPENDPDQDDFKVVSQSDAAETFLAVSSGITMFLVLVAAISLLVGGIGIMNIMLSSVAERTQEVGLRKALGAKNSDIVMQFLIETLLITALAGIIGVLIGIGLSYVIYLVVINFEENWRFMISFETVILSFVISSLVGIVFGLYPARNAARLNPIEALRYE